jgi:hypothetical protein
MGGKSSRELAEIKLADVLAAPGVVGMGLLVFCAMYYFSAVLPMNKEVRLLTSKAAAQPHIRREAEQVTPDKQLASFYHSFLNVKDVPDALEKLHDAAMVQGVTLEQGDYHLVRNGTDKMVRYEIEMPIKGDYLHLRKFLSQALADMPYLALDSVEFQRQKISDTILDAQINKATGSGLISMYLAISLMHGT